MSLLFHFEEELNLGNIKRHRYGIKIFKLCSGDFYTSQYKIYAGKEMVAETAVST